MAGEDENDLSRKVLRCIYVTSCVKQIKDKELHVYALTCTRARYILRSYLRATICKHHACVCFVRVPTNSLPFEFERNSTSEIHPGVRFNSTNKTTKRPSASNSSTQGGRKTAQTNRVHHKMPKLQKPGTLTCEAGVELNNLHTQEQTNGPNPKGKTGR